ncbi:VWA domain-containing protein [Chloroflexota bacterium]
MSIYRYSEWDGSQHLFDLDADELMDELRRNLTTYGKLDEALWQMQRRGVRNSQGRRLPSMQELLEQLRQRKQSQLEKYNLSSVMTEIRQKLSNILKMERQGIQNILDKAREKAGESVGELSPEVQQKLLKTIEDRSAQNLKKLDELPPDIGGQMRELTQYDFMDEEANRQFQELVDMLKKHAMESYGRDLMQQFEVMDDSTLASITHMIVALNQMLEQRMMGEEPDFDSFMEQFGAYFAPQPPQNLDELMERQQNQMVQAQFVLNSLSAEDRESLANIIESMLDEATHYKLTELVANLEALYPSDKLRKKYSFLGEESISYTEALKLMEMLQKTDKLEAQLRDSRDNSLDTIDGQLLRELIGDEAAEELERLRSITKVLEEAGYIRWKDGKYELTPRGVRVIGRKALEHIFAQVRKHRVGRQNIDLRGNGGERIDDTKKYEFGDDFQIHLQKTIMNSIYREPRMPPMELNAEDFEVFKTEALSRSATVLMLDLSLSMSIHGNFEAAKRVALALDALIRSQYPKDILYIMGYSSYARLIKKEDLSYMSWDDLDPYTNMQHGLYLASKLMAKEKCTNKQIILISDGEPTAHFEGGQIHYQYPPSPRTLQATLREVRNCTQKGIVINTFLLERSRSLSSSFVTQMARINRGRIFYTKADTLGQYLLVDYISNKSRRI